MENVAICSLSWLYNALLYSNELLSCELCYLIEAFDWIIRMPYWPNILICSRICVEVACKIFGETIEIFLFENHRNVIYTKCDPVTATIIECATIYKVYKHPIFWSTSSQVLVLVPALVYRWYISSSRLYLYIVTVVDTFKIPTTWRWITGNHGDDGVEIIQGMVTIDEIIEDYLGTSRPVIGLIAIVPQFRYFHTILKYNGQTQQKNSKKLFNWPHI